MSDADDDIFGKIDALLGKRVGFAGATRQREDNDFPLLTEVVEAPGIDLLQPEPSPPEQPEAPLAWQEPVPTPLAEPAPVESDEPVASVAADDIEPMPATEAPPVKEPPALQDAEFEAMLRRIIREELERLLGRG
ncbi:MAG: hypothetical protein IPG66_10185 [Hydrogenophilales bacterium]|nr:hypothetical protein [Hydrogenophilales bacterium]